MSTPKAVLVPGNMCDSRLWSGGADALRRVLTGHGMIDVVDADMTHDATISDMAARALAAGSARLLVIGFSMGAIVALEMARQAPERIAGLVLIGLNAGPDLPERAAHRPVQQAEVRAGGLERVLIEELKPNYLAERNRGDAALLAVLRDMGMALGPHVFAMQSEALRLRDDLRHVLPTLAVPVLLACGAEDALCPPAWHRQWAEAIADAQLLVVPGAGHMLPLEAPQALADRLDAWLTQKEIA